MAVEQIGQIVLVFIFYVILSVFWEEPFFDVTESSVEYEKLFLNIYKNLGLIISLVRAICNIKFFFCNSACYRTEYKYYDVGFLFDKLVVIFLPTFFFSRQGCLKILKSYSSYI